MDQPLPLGVDLADDLELIEMANLPREDTGVDGTIYISSMQASQGPRVEWYPGRPRHDAPFLTVTLEDPPRAINQGLSVRDARLGEAAAARWVLLNREALLDFWINGYAWTIDELHAFTKRLVKLS